MGANKLTTRPNFGRDSVGNHANKHDSPSSPATSDASNSNSRSPGNFDGNGGCADSMRHRERKHKRLRSTAPRLHRRLGLLHPRSGYYLVALLLIVPLSSALAIPSVSFTEATIEGQFSATGLPLGLQSKGGHDELYFHLTGQYEVEVEYSNFIINFGVSLDSDSGTEPSITDSGDAALFVQPRGDFLLKFNQGTGSLVGNAGVINRENGNQEWDKSFDQARQPLRVETQKTIQQGIRQSGEIFAEGNFQFSIWNGDLTTHDNHFWAGPEAGSDPLEIGQGRSQIIHVTVNNGTLQGNLPGNQVETFWKTSTLTGKDSIALSGARDLQGTFLGTVKVTENWELNLEGGEALTASQIKADEATIAGATVQAPRNHALWWLSLLGLVPIGILLRYAPNAQVKRMERNLNRSRYEKVAGKPIRKLLAGKFAGRASLYRATSLLALGLYQEAALFLESLKHESRPDPATYHFLYAHALASQGQKIDAGRHLLKCLKLVPDYAAEAEAIPVLCDLLGSIGIARSLSGESYS